MYVKIYICDDEPIIRSDLSKSVSTLVPNSYITEYASGLELIEKMSEEACDILLLDIDMPDLSGLDIAKRLGSLPKKPLLVFVTGHDELVYDSLQFHPFGFVRKSHIDSELTKILADCIDELKSHERHFAFHTAAVEIKLRLDEIIYFEADGNYLKLFTPNDEYRFRDTLGAVENSLLDYGFVRIHKGFLLNQAAVKKLYTDEIELTDGSRLPIGRSYQDSARKAIMRYMLK